MMNEAVTKLVEALFIAMVNMYPMKNGLFILAEVSSGHL